MCHTLLSKCVRNPNIAIYNLHSHKIIIWTTHVHRFSISKCFDFRTVARIPLKWDFRKLHIQVEERQSEDNQNKNTTIQTHVRGLYFCTKARCIEGTIVKMRVFWCRWENSCNFLSFILTEIRKSYLKPHQGEILLNAFGAIGRGCKDECKCCLMPAVRSISSVFIWTSNCSVDFALRIPVNLDFGFYLP